MRRKEKVKELLEELKLYKKYLLNLKVLDKSKEKGSQKVLKK